MCRHEVVTFGCGHREDLGFFCDYAEGHGSFFNKAACPNYTFGEVNNKPLSQCGRQGNFYCAQKQDGVVIDKAREALDVAEAHLSETKRKSETLAVLEASYVSEAGVRRISREDLPKYAAYHDHDQQRKYVELQYLVAHNRVCYLNSIINHAWRNRDRLALGVGYQPVWDGIHFDFSNSVFPPKILQPIKDQLPGFSSKTPTSLANSSYQRRDPLPAASTHANVNTAQQFHSPLPARSTQRAKAAQPTGPINNTNSTAEHSSPTDQAFLRGNSPEGEDKMAKAIRIRDELAARRNKIVSSAMADIGYDVENNGLRPSPKAGNKRNEECALTPTPSKKNGKKMSKVEEPDVTPSKARPSRRTRNSKPKYVESPNSSEKTLGFREPSLDKSDAAWTESPAKSDAAWNESPTLSQESTSPIRPVRNSKSRNKRNVDPLTGSPNSSPMRSQVSLSEKILQYKKSLGSSTFAGPPQMQPFSAVINCQNENTLQDGAAMRSTAPQVPALNTSFNSIGQISNGQVLDKAVNQQGCDAQHGIATGGYADGGGTYTSQQNVALMQRGAQLVENLGRDLYQQQTASGIFVGSSTTDPAQDVACQQHVASSTMGLESQVMQPQQPSSVSYTMSPESLGHLHVGQTRAPANFFHQNYQQSMAANNAQPYPGFSHRSFSAGPMPVSVGFNQSVPGTPAAVSGPEPSLLARPRADYENMRRSFSTAANLTPQSSSDAQHNAAYTEPVKRSMMHTSPALTSRKRIRLSYPGEDEVPRLAPTPPSFEPDISAGVAVDGATPLTSHDAAFADVEEQYKSCTSFDSALLGTQPRENVPHDSSAQPGHYAMSTPADVLALDPQLYGTAVNRIGMQSANDAKPYRDSAAVDPHTALSHFDKQTLDSFGTQMNGSDSIDTGSHFAQHSDMSLPHDGLYAGGLDVFDLSSEPDWSLIQDDAY